MCWCWGCCWWIEIGAWKLQIRCHRDSDQRRRAPVTPGNASLLQLWSSVMVNRRCKCTSIMVNIRIILINRNICIHHDYSFQHSFKSICQWKYIRTFLFTDIFVCVLDYLIFLVFIQFLIQILIRTSVCVNILIRIFADLWLCPIFWKIRKKTLYIWTEHLFV